MPDIIVKRTSSSWPSKASTPTCPTTGIANATPATLDKTSTGANLPPSTTRGPSPISAKIGCKVLKEVAKSLSTRVQTRKERPMPLQEITSQYAQLRQELPPESAHLARECQAFQRARVIESAEDLLYLVLLYSSADLSVREIAGVCAGSGHPLSDEAV